MGKLFYCTECKRVINSGEKCNYCNGENIKDLSYGTPVNVIGTKTKGRVLKIKDNVVRLLVRDEYNNKFIKEYESGQLRKVL
ncbi:hypothetical protein [uncultured Clostridium sp.]|uniref:hypothetical protein n=1 Tax=uncultured Clostridium sp. TaxID=59620 RepID=UPI0028E2C465|nr:hypothetical protein [uncultured Clostridium sp.]